MRWALLGNRCTRAEAHLHPRRVWFHSSATRIEKQQGLGEGANWAVAGAGVVVCLEQGADNSMIYDKRYDLHAIFYSSSSV